MERRDVMVRTPSHSGGPRLESWQWHRLSWHIFRRFTQSFQEDARIVLGNIPRMPCTPYIILMLFHSMLSNFGSRFNILNKWRSTFSSYSDVVHRFENLKS